MKPELSLPERPSALFLLAAVNLLVVLLIFFTLIPAVAQQAGVVIESPRIASRAPDLNPAKVTSVTVLSGPTAKIIVSTEEGNREVALGELTEELIRQREDRGIEGVYVLPDKRANVGLVMGEVMFAIYAADLEVILGGTLPSEATER